MLRSPGRFSKRPIVFFAVTPVIAIAGATPTVTMTPAIIATASNPIRADPAPPGRPSEADIGSMVSTRSGATRPAAPGSRERTRSHERLGVRHDPAAHSQHDRDPQHLGRAGLGARADRPGPGGRSGRLSEAAGGAGLMAVADRLAELGLELPTVPEPAGAYVPAVVTGSLVFTAGQLPFVDGALPETGLVGEGEGQVAPSRAADLAALCALNALAAAAGVLGVLDRVSQVVKVTGFVASAPGFTAQPSVLNGASQLLGDLFGDDGRHARSAVGAAALPLGSPVEVELVLEYH